MPARLRPTYPESGGILGDRPADRDGTGSPAAFYDGPGWARFRPWERLFLAAPGGRGAGTSPDPPAPARTAGRPGSWRSGSATARTCRSCPGTGTVHGVDLARTQLAACLRPRSRGWPAGSPGPRPRPCPSRTGRSTPLLDRRLQLLPRPRRGPPRDEAGDPAGRDPGRRRRGPRPPPVRARPPDRRARAIDACWLRGASGLDREFVAMVLGHRARRRAGCVAESGRARSAIPDLGPARLLPGRPRAESERTSAGRPAGAIRHDGDRITDRRSTGPRTSTSGAASPAAGRSSEAAGGPGLRRLRPGVSRSATACWSSRTRSRDNNKVARDFYNSPLWPKFRFWEWFTFVCNGGERRSRDKILRHLPKAAGLKLLDVAIGDGVYLDWLPRDWSVVGDRRLDHAARRLPDAGPAGRDLRLVLGEAEDLPVRDGRFDAALSIGGFNYFNDPEKALREMARAVKPGGTIVVSDEIPNLTDRMLFRKLGLPGRRPLDRLEAAATWATTSPTWSSATGPRRRRRSADRVLPDCRYELIWTGVGYVLVGEVARGCMRFSTFIARNLLRRGVRTALTVLGPVGRDRRRVTLTGDRLGVRAVVPGDLRGEGDRPGRRPRGDQRPLTSNLDAGLADRLREIDGVRDGRRLA